MFGKRRFFAPEEDARLVEAIRRAEEGSAGEVMLHIEPKLRSEALERARTMFFRLGMDKTQADTGVLLYVAVDSRKVAVFAGSGLHGAERPAFWQDIVDKVALGYKDGRPVEGLIEAIDAIGAALRQHFPSRDVAGNELPNKVSTS